MKKYQLYDHACKKVIAESDDTIELCLYLENMAKDNKTLAESLSKNQPTGFVHLGRFEIQETKHGKNN